MRWVAKNGSSQLYRHFSELLFWMESLPTVATALWTSVSLLEVCLSIPRTSSRPCCWGCQLILESDSALSGQKRVMLSLSVAARRGPDRELVCVANWIG